MTNAVAQADLIFTHGIILTGRITQSRPEAVAVAGDKIIAVGDVADVMTYRGKTTTVVDLDGRTLIPGFYDVHQHQLYRGLSMTVIDARVDDMNLLLTRIAERTRTTPSGQWLQAIGYDDTRIGGHPRLEDLDRVAPNHPLMITRACNHVVVGNSRALALAGIGRDTQDPEGGRIDRDARTAEPTGILRERAMELLRRVVPPPTNEEFKQAIVAAAEDNLRMGITSVWDPSIEPAQHQAYAELAAAGDLPVRTTMGQRRVIRDGTSVPLPEPYAGPWLSMNAVKLFQDGAIGPHTALLSEPYEGDHGNYGVAVLEQHELDAYACEAAAAGLQITIHAIGDKAIEMSLRAISVAHSVNGPRRRHRIEHCGLLLPRLHEQMRQVGAIPIVSPTFLHTFGDSYFPALGEERCAWAYPLKTMMRLSPVVAAGSDGPVVPDCSPLLGIQTAVLRRSRDGRPFSSTESVTVSEALAMYTMNAAYAAEEEDAKGSIAPGKFADLVVLAADPRRTPIDDVAEIPIEAVVVGGHYKLGSPE